MIMKYFTCMQAMVILRQKINILFSVQQPISKVKYFETSFDLFKTINIKYEICVLVAELIELV